MAIVLAIYTTVFGALLIATNGLPYVFDNNETFSSIVHAYNMFTQGIGETFGLTDESYGRTDESRPYLYTHQGNFPRLFALLIYWLGARTGEAQIVVTTFTVGVAAISFAYDVIARRAGWAVGVLFCALMITDYIMVVQWQVNTWRVWHMFFFFLSLLCVDHAAAGRPRLWLIILLVEHAALFYFELIFGAFTAATTGLFAIMTLGRRLRMSVAIIAAQISGMLLGIGILVAQLWAYFGWEDFLTDLRLTFLARNESMGGDSRAAAEQFMIEHKIAFWYNINELVGLRQPSVMIEKFFSLTLGIYTPALVTMAVVTTSAVFIHRLHSATASHILKFDKILPLRAAELVVGALFILYALSVMTGLGVTGFPGHGSNSIEAAFLGVVSLLMLGGLLRNVRLQAVNGRVAVSALVTPAVALVLAIACLVGTERLYGPLTPYWGDLTPVWSAIAGATGALQLQLMILFTGWIAARIAIGTTSVVSSIIDRLGRLLAIVLAGLIAYAIVYLLSPGYVVTGYLHRFAPFVTFVNLVPFAIGMSAIAVVVYGDIVILARQPWWRALWYPTKAGIKVRPLPTVVIKEGSMILASIAAALILPCYWVIVQTTYFARLPPDQYAFLPLLGEPPFKGASFVVNTYAAPIAVETENWAYYDQLLGYRRLESNNGETRLVRDRHYLWLADRDINPAYLKPDYFLCVALQDIGTAIRPEIVTMNGCSHLPLIRSTGQTIPGVLTADLVAQDNSGRDRWAIMRLNWHLP